MWKQTILLMASAAAVMGHHERVLPLRAVALLASPSGKPIGGNITLTQLQDGTVKVEGTILGLAPGEYGFHVHEKGDLTGGCGSTGSHYNPEHKDHGHPNDENRHVGDLGNIVSEQDGTATVNIVDNKISLIGPHCVIGRAIVLHEKADDYGKSDHPDSKKTGNAGGRVACGVIGILDPIYDGWNSNGASTSSLAATIFLPILSVVFLMF